MGCQNAGGRGRRRPRQHSQPRFACHLSQDTLLQKHMTPKWRRKRAFSAKNLVLHQGVAPRPINRQKTWSSTRVLPHDRLIRAVTRLIESTNTSPTSARHVRVCAPSADIMRAYSPHGTHLPPRAVARLPPQGSPPFSACFRMSHPGTRRHPAPSAAPLTAAGSTIAGESSEAPSARVLASICTSF